MDFYEAVKHDRRKEALQIYRRMFDIISKGGLSHGRGH